MTDAHDSITLRTDMCIYIYIQRHITYTHLQKTKGFLFNDWLNFTSPTAIQSTKGFKARPCMAREASSFRRSKLCMARGEL